MKLFRWITFPALVFALALTACSGGGEPEQVAEQPAAAEHAGSHDPVAVEATEMDSAAVQQRLAAGEEIFLLDVRNPDELVEHGAIEGYVNIPIDELESRIAEVPKDKPIVTYCMAGGRASRAAKLLRDNGYDQPIEYGGITAWKAAGNPVVQPHGE